MKLRRGSSEEIGEMMEERHIGQTRMQHQRRINQACGGAFLRGAEKGRGGEGGRRR